MKKNLLQAFCMLAVIVGTGVGFFLRNTVRLSENMKKWVGIPGELLINMLKMFSVSLIVTSVVAGVTGLNTKVSKKTALITGAFICGSTMIAVIVGLFLVLTFEPGREEHETDLDKGRESNAVLHVIMQDLIRNMVPESFFQAFYEHYKTEIVEIKNEKSGPEYDHTSNETEIKLIGGYVDGPNMIGLVIWSFTIGVLLSAVGQEARTTVEIIQCLNDAIKIIVNWILWYLPIGVLFLITKHVVDVRDWGIVFKLTKFIGVVLAGQAIQSLIIFPTLYAIIVRRNPFNVIRQISKALTTAFIIASSAAALPITLQCCEENLKVNTKLCRLMLPILTSINRNGMVVYEVISAVFMAQLHDISLDAGQLIAIGLTASIVAFGTAGTPSSGALNSILILTAVGLPADHVGLLIGVEWILDHFMTVVNVMVNVFGVAITNHLWYSNRKNISSTDGVSAIQNMELDLSVLDSDDDFVPSTSSSISTSILSRKGSHVRT
ncbi:excitatory amino acid transporter 3-like [Poeciliopsis prolifica]|uniref:excitatory amino acid transporter 3-like n=1 Tax=Poeciliopsis prolifica TaxID=188132 RepID=UPI002413F791|nr:excitatory amino acid transporter 3-like [Poeciliopsis prolifica]